MKRVVFSTGNDEKFAVAQAACKRYDVELIQKTAETVEIQSEDPQQVAVDKAVKAYAVLQEPVVVNDDSWAFLGLRGFPGVYMHSINEWFTAEDFLRLTSALVDRRIVLTRYVVYQDQDTQKIFTHQIEGELLRTIRGTSKHPNHLITTLAGDNGLSIAEAYDQADDKATRGSAEVWNEFASWLSTKH